MNHVAYGGGQEKDEWSKWQAGESLPTAQRSKYKKSYV